MPDQHQTMFNDAQLKEIIKMAAAAAAAQVKLDQQMNMSNYQAGVLSMISEIPTWAKWLGGGVAVAGIFAGGIFVGKRCFGND